LKGAFSPVATKIVPPTPPPLKRKYMGPWLSLGTGAPKEEPHLPHRLVPSESVHRRVHSDTYGLVEGHRLLKKKPP